MILIENTKTYLTGISNIVIKPNTAPKNIILKPGINTIDSDSWEVMKNNYLVQEQLNNGTLVVAHNNIDCADSADETLASLHYTQAQKIIKSTFDYELLKKWSANESRTAVVKSLDAQLNLIEAKQVSEEKFM